MGPYDLVLLHAQPGLGADWQQVLARLPGGIRAVAPDRPGYGSSRLAGGGFEVNVTAVLDDLDARGIERAVLVGHSYGGGVALTVAARAPERVQALILLATVGPDCLNGWDRLLAAPGAGPVCALFAWQFTPWFARARLSRLARRHGARSSPELSSLVHDSPEHVNWYVWGYARREHGPLWRTFLAEQRALMREAQCLALLAPAVRAPVLLVADPRDTIVPIRTANRLAQLLPDARLSLVEGVGHHLPLRAPDRVADEIVAFLDWLGSRTGDDPLGSRAGDDSAAPA